MPNLRILADDAIQRATSITASNTAGAMIADYLRNPKKSLVHRATGKTVEYRAGWATPEVISAVVVPFCDWSPTALWRIRLTNEPSVTNMFAYTEAFDNAAWVKTNITFGAAAAAPDGATTAETISCTAAGVGYVAQDENMAQNVAYPVSCFFKAGTFTGSVSISDATQAGAVTFDLSTKAVSRSGIATNAAATDVGGGWWRVSATFTSTGATGNHTFRIGNFNALTTVLIWGAMFQSGSETLTSYYSSAAAAAGVRPLGYMDAWQSYDYDSGYVLACPAPAFKLPGRWTLAQSMTAYAYGGGALARAWLRPTAAVAMSVTVNDPDNVVGYLETSQMLAGGYWEAKVNADYGASVTPLDTDKLSRSDAGDLITEIGTRHVKLAISMSKMAAADRDRLWEMLRGCGSREPVYINLAPEHADLKYERMYSIVGKLIMSKAMTLPSFNIAASSVEIESL